MGAAQDCHPTVGALKTASVYEASLTAASRGRSLSLHLISLICLNITSVGPICIQALRSALSRYLLCVLGSALVGIHLRICQKTTSRALLLLLRALEVCQIARVLCLPSYRAGITSTHHHTSFIWAWKPKLWASCFQGVLVTVQLLT